MKKLLSILFFLCITNFSYSQTFTQTFIDRCTGEVQVVTNLTEFLRSASFYNEAKVFTYQQYLNGELQQWLVQKYKWWKANFSPCSTVKPSNKRSEYRKQPTNTTNTATNNTNTNTSGSTSSGSTSIRVVQVVVVMVQVVEPIVVHQVQVEVVRVVEIVVHQAQVEVVPILVVVEVR